MGVLEIRVEGLKQRPDAGENLFLLDVREPGEVAEFGMLRNAVHIPMGELRDRLVELPRDRKILIYCQKGQRGYLAACALLGSDFKDVVNLRGGFAQARLNGF